MTSSSPAGQQPGPPLIRLQSVQKSFTLPSGEVFDGVRSLSLVIHEGEGFGLVGKSGAAK